MEALAGLTDSQINELLWDWRFWARPKQLEPEGTWWTVWLILAGRGFGKTRTGAEWIRDQVCGRTPYSRGRVSFGRIALVGETAADVRDVMVEGDSGLLAIHPAEFRPVYEPSKRRLTWPNGMVATTYSAEDPEQLRGPQHALAWADELGKWKYAQETWDQLQFGMRVGNPRIVVTTTPRPIPLVRELLKIENEFGGTVVTRGSTYDNRSNLSERFLKRMSARYEGTRLGRQELHAEVLDDVPGGLWQRRMFEVRSEDNPIGALMRASDQLPAMRRVVVAVDPSGASGADDDADEIGIGIAGEGWDGLYYVLGDETCMLGPAGWARRTVDMFDYHKADRVIGESNFGGAMVEHTIRTVRKNIPYFPVHASRGKVLRAEPVAALYEQGRVRHKGSFAALENEMLNMTTTGFIGNGSPNRVDAIVFALTELALGPDTTSSTGTVKGAH